MGGINMSNRISTIAQLKESNPKDNNSILIGTDEIRHFLDVPVDEVLYRVNILVSLMACYRLTFMVDSDKIFTDKHNYVTMILLLFHHTGEWPHFISIYSDPEYPYHSGIWAPDRADELVDCDELRLKGGDTHPISIFSFKSSLSGSYHYFKLRGNDMTYEFIGMARIQNLLKSIKI